MIEISDIELLVIKKMLKKMNIDVTGYKDDFLRRRIRSRMLMLKLNSTAEYLRYLKHNKTERLKLLNALKINVSNFFRDPPLWKFLEHKIFPQLIKKVAETGTTLRIWSAGCASGQEPYSIAMLALEVAERMKCNVRINIYATDINENALLIARNGIYGLQEIRNIPPNLISKYFRYVRGGLFEIKPHIKRLIQFKRHDLLKDNPPLFINIIFCRNVLIYFNKNTQVLVLKKFYRSLVNNGFLVLGMTESLPKRLNSLFEPVSLKYRVYIKKSILQ